MGAGLGFKTFVTGDVLTAADTNGYLMQGVWVFANATARDAAVTSPQEGNMCYLKDTDAVQYYSGSAWTAVAGATFAGCYLTKSAAQSLSNATDTAITWDTESFDVGSYHSVATNTSRITIPAGKAGYYLLNAQLLYGANATGNRVISVRKNGSNISVTPPGYGGNITITGASVIYQTSIVSAAVADYFEIFGSQSSGGALNVHGNELFSAPGSIFQAVYLGA
jgi:hypothetical protein